MARAPVNTVVYISGIGEYKTTSQIERAKMKSKVEEENSHHSCKISRQHRPQQLIKADVQAVSHIVKNNPQIKQWQIPNYLVNSIKASCNQWHWIHQQLGNTVPRLDISVKIVRDYSEK